MKKYFLILLFTVVILTGCSSKSSFSVSFDTFTMKLYDNKKQYLPVQVDTNTAGMKALIEMKQKIGTGYTGYISSFIVVKTLIQSGLDMKALVDANTKKNQIKLLKYTSTDNEKKKIKCGKLQYSGYITAFSYLLEKTTLYGGQYFFTDGTTVYIVSLSSAIKKDVNSFITSIGTIKCSK